MKKTVLFVLLGSLLLIPAVVCAEPDQTATKAPPVSQPLVREGDFAVKLVESLKIGTAKSEAEAEAMLVSSGIAPRNGWIADYPVTPDVIAELHKTVSDAADAKRLSMGKEEALKALRTVAVELELPIIAEVPNKYAEGPPSAAPQYSQPSVIDNYYYTEGPPVVTYYPPPWDYAYLYAWVPTPFFFGTFFFPGFFILNDFDIVVFRHFDHFGHHFHHGFHHGHDFGHRITNHFTDPKTHQVMRVDPTMRTRGFNSPVARGAAFSSPQARRGAASIANRSVQAPRSRGPRHASSRRASATTFLVKPSWRPSAVRSGWCARARCTFACHSTRVSHNRMASCTRASSPR